MVFSTIIFLFRFLPITLLLYYLAPPKLKNTVLFFCSLVFYCWGEVKYFPIMIVLILINYISGLCLEKWEESVGWRRFWLVFAVVGSLSMLIYFKYTNFFITSLNALFGWKLATIAGVSVLPLGISFYTFQTLSYSIDVYRREVKAEHNIIDFGAYVVMFPQLIAGPIVKYRDVAAQLHVYKGRIQLSQIEDGITTFIFGLAKKVLLADTIGKLWTDIVGVAADPTVSFVGLANASSGLVWLGVIAYSLQLYFDFSGYSMMAIGMGKMLGFEFPQNFNYPYISASITEFWRRWHMTLSGWFREYVYIPLGGNRNGLVRQIFNIFVVWALTGFWHGANWNFICWGLYYFVLLMLEKTFLLKYLKKGKVWPHIYTLFLVVVGWAMFVGNDKGVQFGLLFQKLFLPSGGVSALYFLRNYAVLLAVSVVCCTPLIEKLWNAMKKITWVRLVTLGLLLAVTTAYIVGSTNSPFLYFNF
ncbi:MAG: MBOAT family protein [Faecalibacterium sp.]|nr:MBOAT family protein [Faecalibacterium sp.]